MHLSYWIDYFLFVLLRHLQWSLQEEAISVSEDHNQNYSKAPSRKQSWTQIFAEETYAGSLWDSRRRHVYRCASTIQGLNHGECAVKGKSKKKEKEWEREREGSFHY